MEDVRELGVAVKSLDEIESFLEVKTLDLGLKVFVETRSLCKDP